MGKIVRNQAVKEIDKTDGEDKSRSSPENDPLLTPQQLAEMLHWPLSSVYDARYRGTGPKGIKINARTLRFRLSDVKAWLATHETMSSAE